MSLQWCEAQLHGYSAGSTAKAFKSQGKGTPSSYRS